MIEAASILPLFAIGLLTLVSILPMRRTAMKLQEGLFVAAEEMAVECADGHATELSGIRDTIKEILSDEDAGYIRNGTEGIDMSGSVLDDPEYRKLIIKCDLIPFGRVFGALSVPFERKCLVHVWNGYGRGYYPDDDYVFITQDSEVYHRDRNCTHIRLSIRETDPDSLPDLRNEYGSRYRPCEFCHSRLSDVKLYITSDGDRYHNTITCSALKRTVRAIRMSEAKGRRPCSRCGR